MKYTVSIEIALPRDEVIKKLDNQDHMKHWMRGLLDAELLSGEAGTEGARTNMRFKMGKREMEMVETIIKRNFPEEFHATYDTKGVHNIQRNYFIENDEKTKTTWKSDCEFQFASLGMKAMAFLMPGAFKKQSMKYAQDFKNFAEKGISVADQN